MAYKLGEIELQRLKSLLIHDKVSTPTQFADVIKSDVYNVLSNFMELYSDDIEVKIEAGENCFHILISAYTKRFRQIGTLPKAYKE